MRVLMVHNRYQQRGGEDAVVEAETRLLASRGVEVERFDADNDAIAGFAAKVQVSLRQFTAAAEMERRFRRVVEGFRPDVVHVHNWFPMISASIFSQCKSAGIPVVHTIHNYRLLCVGATLFRDGRVCEDCIGTRFRTAGVVHRCYRGSTLGSAVATAGMLSHWSAGTWHKSVDRFIALTEFARTKLVEAGLPAEKIVVKPNFVESAPAAGRGEGNYFLYAGRLAEEKGIRTLLECWKKSPDLPALRIVGDGPLRPEVTAAAMCLRNVEWMGIRSAQQVSQLMENAIATLCPSLWYEGMPRVVIESLAAGTPVIASDLGGYPEMIEDGVNGALVAAGDTAALLHRVMEFAATANRDKMRMQARQRYLREYTPERNFSLLLGIYRGMTGLITGSEPILNGPEACVA